MGEGILTFPPLAEELLSIDGCWGGESVLSSDAAPHEATHVPAKGPTPVLTQAAIAGPSRHLERATWSWKGITVEGIGKQWEETGKYGLEQNALYVCMKFSH